MDWSRLTTYLAAAQRDQLLTFSEVESICGGALPASKQYPAFWSNSSSYAKHWTRAGFKVSRAGCLPERVKFLLATAEGPREWPARGGDVVKGLVPSMVASIDGAERITLIGCVKTKRQVPAVARDLYDSPLFDRRRAYAEATMLPWFVLSAEYGLVAPDEFISPYDTYLPNMPGSYKRVWGEWCATRLVHLIGALDGRVIEIHAGAAYVDAVRGPLAARGAVVSAPLEGMRQGEQLAWYPAQVGVAGATPPVPVTPRHTDPDHSEAISAQAVADALLKYRIEHMNDDEAEPLGGYGEAGQLLASDPFAFLVAVIFDEGIIAERAWRAPWELRRRLGHLDPTLLRNQRAEVSAAVSLPPALHRYVGLIPQAVSLAAERVCDQYGGDASRIWADGTSVREVDRRLKEFKRIGQKKAAMAVEILLSKFGADLTGVAETDIAYDVQVRRVFLRTGIVDRDDRGTMIRAARQLHPDRPGYIDAAAWHIGREWCRPTYPRCGECPLTGVCAKRTVLGP